MSVVDVKDYCKHNTWLGIVIFTDQCGECYIGYNGCGDVNGFHCGVGLYPKFPASVKWSALLLTLLSLLVILLQ